MSSSNRDDEMSDAGESVGVGRCDDVLDSIASLVAETPESVAQRLTSTIVSEIIPRLMLSHRVNTPIIARVRGNAAVDVSDVSSFVDILLSSDSERAQFFIDDVLSRGVPLDAILMELMAPAARRLGDMWTADECDFVDVTLGVSRMHALLRRFSGQMGVNDNKPVHGRKALLVPAPGEQHTFGLRIVEEFLLRDGWAVRAKLDATLDETAAMLKAEHFDFVGFTMSGEVLVSALREAINVTRKVSKNQSIRIIVGGTVFAKQPALAEHLGADGLALEAAQAVNQARQWAQLN
jgi:methanogenic corrinoid protein MtbC1